MRRSDGSRGGVQRARELLDGPVQVLVVALALLAPGCASAPKQVLVQPVVDSAEQAC